MKVKVLLLFFALLCAFNLRAQRNCGSMEHLAQQLQEDPKMYQKMKSIERATQHFIDNPQKAVTGIITIPVVVHVVYNTAAENISDSQVQSQITVLTDDFRRLNSDANGNWPQAADTEIEFCLATVDPNGNPTNGITRTSTSVTSFSTNDNMKFNSSGGKDAWPASDYLNFWVCDLGGGILGYAQFPGGPPSTDGVVCDYQYVGTNGTATAPFDLGRTATHEVGHWLNLRHIWGDGNCNFDDFVSDTPDSDNPNYGCATGHVSCGTTDMVENYMDYSDDACMNLYTSGQKTRMRAIFDTGGARESLLSSGGCGTSNPPTCTDGIQNGNETGIDCGGPDCPACVCNGTEVTLTIILDDYPEETSWTIVDGGGNTVASGGTYGNLPDGSTFTETNCLADGCFDFTIFDSYGDGICCAYGNGSYLLEDSSGNVLASGGAFGSSETTNFCLGGGGGPTCDDGIQNGNETGVDCGGPDCDPCSSGCTYQTINFNNFDSGWGIWNDGGSDCRRSANDAQYAYSGNRCVRLRDNTNSSVMTTDNLDLSGYSEITLDFTYITASMENGEDFWLQYSQDGGASYTTLVTWTRGVDFNNNAREFETLIITGTFSSTFRFRFRCDASNNGDRVYIDDMDISGCFDGTTRETEVEETLITDIESTNKSEIESLHIYPNPAQYELNLDISMSLDKEVQLNIIDTEGRLVKRKNIFAKAGTEKMSIDITDLDAGIYILQMTTEHERIVKKFSVLR